MKDGLLMSMAMASGHSIQPKSLGLYNSCVPILCPISPKAEHFTVSITKLLWIW